MWGIKKSMSTGLLLLGALFWSGVSWADDPDLFSDGSVVYYTRKVPLIKCADVESPEPGYNCVETSDYAWLRFGPLTDILVTCENTRIQIPPFAMKLCAIKTADFAQAEETEGSSEQCTGYLPLSQHAGLDEHDGRLYVFLYVDMREGHARVETEDEYLARFQYPKILEIPIRGDHMGAFASRRTDDLMSIDHDQLKSLLFSELGLSEVGMSTRETVEDVRKFIVSSETQPAETQLVAEHVFRYAFAKQLMGLSYLYAQILERQGISVSMSLENRIAQMEALSSTPITVESEVVISGERQKLSRPLTAYEEFVQAILQRDRDSGVWEGHPVWGAAFDREDITSQTTADTLSEACTHATLEHRWVDYTFEDGSDEQREVAFYQRFMRSIFTPWLCESYLVGKALLSPGGGRLPSALRDLAHRYARRDPISYARLRISDMEDISTHFDNIAISLEREVKGDVSTPVTYTEALRIEDNLKYHQGLIQKYQRVIEALPRRPEERKTKTLAPEFLSQFIRGSERGEAQAQEELEQFSTTSVDSFMGQMRQRVLNAYRRLIFSQGIKSAYESVERAFLSPAGYEYVRDAGIAQSLNITGDLARRMGFGVELGDQQSLLIPRVLATLRTTAMRYLYELVRTMGVHNALQRELITRYFNVNAITRILLSSEKIHSGIPERWVWGDDPQRPQISGSRENHRAILRQLTQTGVGDQGGAMEYLTLSKLASCFTRSVQVGREGAQYARITVKRTDRRCVEFVDNVRKGFQQLDWLVYYYKLLLDGRTLDALQNGQHFKLEPGYGKLVVHALEPTPNEKVTHEVGKFRKLFFAQDKALRPFQDTLRGAGVDANPISTRSREDYLAVTPQRWQRLEELFPGVSTCAPDHWCKRWYAKAFYKVIDAPVMWEIAPSLVGVPGYVATVTVEEVKPALLEYQKIIRAFSEQAGYMPHPFDQDYQQAHEDQLPKDVGELIKIHYQKWVRGEIARPPFLFRVSSTSLSPLGTDLAFYKQYFLVFESDRKYNMVTQLSLYTGSYQRITKTSDTGQIEHVLESQLGPSRFVSLPMWFSYPQLYGDPTLYTSELANGFDLLMQDFVNGFQSPLLQSLSGGSLSMLISDSSGTRTKTFSSQTPEFIKTTRRKKWMPFSQEHRWSKDGNKVMVNAGGLLLVLDKNAGLVFRSDSPDSMGTRYLRAGVQNDREHWHHHPYDTFAYGPPMGVMPGKRYNFVEYDMPETASDWLVQGLAHGGEVIWETISGLLQLRLIPKPGATYRRRYDPDRDAFVVTRHSPYLVGSDRQIEVNPEGLTLATNIQNIRAGIPHVKIMPTMPYTLGYEPPSAQYARRLSKLAYINVENMPTYPGVLELFHQPALDIEFSDDGQELWVLSHVATDPTLAMPDRTYMSHIDLRSSQRHPHLVTWITRQESLSQRDYPGLSDWMALTGDHWFNGGDIPGGLDVGFFSGLWLAARQSYHAESRQAERGLEDVSFYRHMPRVRTVAIGKNEGVFAITAFPHEYEAMMERYKKIYGVTETGEAAYPTIFNPTYWGRVAYELQQGDVSDRYKQYLLYVKWDVNDKGRSGKPGLRLVSRHRYKLQNQIWGKLQEGERPVPVPNMHLIEGLVISGGETR